MRILVIDDDPMILKGLRRTFRLQRPGWEIVPAASGEEAIERLSQAPFDLVLTDMQMPGVDGSQVLKQARRLQPDAVRVVLSGHAPLRHIIEAEGDYHRFLTKPVDPDHLVSIIGTFGLDDCEEGTRKARSLVAGLERIPSLSRYLMELRQVLAQPKPDPRAVADVISQDIGMAAKVLKLVNTVYLPFERAITSLHQAVEFLGLELIQEMALNRDILAASLDETPEGLNLEALWAHSQHVGRVARDLIYVETGSRLAAEEAYSVGLLHDVGMVVLATNPDCAYRSILDQAFNPEELLTTLERQKLGTDHVQVGAQLLELWGLPEPFGSAIREHHGAGLRGHSSLVSLALVLGHSKLGQTRAQGRPFEGWRLNGYGGSGGPANLEALWEALVGQWRNGRPGFAATLEAETKGGSHEP